MLFFDKRYLGAIIHGLCGMQSLSCQTQVSGWVVNLIDCVNVECLPNTLVVVLSKFSRSTIVTNIGLTCVLDFSCSSSDRCCGMFR